MTQIITWNVNGLRAIQKKGFLEWFAEESPDYLCLQETKIQKEQIPKEFLELDYHHYWAFAEKKGYSGLAIFSKKPCKEEKLLGIDEFDKEGRVQVLDYEDFCLINTYFPNSQDAGRRLGYKLDYCDAILKLCQDLDTKKRPFVLCGDLNIAHKPIDLFHPKANEKSPGYLPEERAWLDKFVEAGFIDCFRQFNKKEHQYTWWSYRTKARERNVGWRLDYHLSNKIMFPKIKATLIMNEVYGSDHCPVKLVLN